jgi:TPR repeat protein
MAMRLGTRCCEKGYGIKKDIPKALELYEKSVELGNKDACFSIARIYEKGENIKMDLSKAIIIETSIDKSKIK